MKYKSDKQATRIIRYLLTVIIVSAIFFICRYCNHCVEKDTRMPRDYAAIAEEGILRVTTEYNPVSFYTNGDTTSGFDYELIQAFAHEKGLKVQFTPEISFNKRLKGLANGQYDIIAMGIPTIQELKDSLRLTLPIMLNRQVLVQRKHNDSLQINSHLDLAGCTLHIVKGSPSILRVRNLGNEIGDTIYIKEVAKCSPDQLVKQVADGKIDYAVCDENIAQAIIDSFPQIDISKAISFTQFYSWAVSKKSPALADSLNDWISRFQKKKEYQEIYRKYHPKSKD